MSTDQCTTTPIRTCILKGTPTTQLFVIESVEYPGYYLKYNSNGTNKVNINSTNSSMSNVPIQVSI